MGTRLMALGLDPRSDDPALWNLSRPDDVLAIHRRDVAAGAGAILTNTFGANRFWLRKFGQDGAVESINRRAVRLARRAAGPRPVCDRQTWARPPRSKREPRSSRRRSWSTPAPTPSSSRPIALPSWSGCSVRSAGRWPPRFRSWPACGNGPIPRSGRPATARCRSDRDRHELPARHRGRGRVRRAAARASAVSLARQTERGRAEPAR